MGFLGLWVDLFLFPWRLHSRHPRLILLWRSLRRSKWFHFCNKIAHVCPLDPTGVQHNSWGRLLEQYKCRDLAQCGASLGFESAWEEHVLEVCWYVFAARHLAAPSRLEQSGKSNDECQVGCKHGILDNWCRIFRNRRSTLLFKTCKSVKGR